MFVTKDFLSFLCLFWDRWNNNIEAIFQLVPLLPCLYVNITHVLGKWIDNINDALLLFLTQDLCITYFYQVHWWYFIFSPKQTVRDRDKGERSSDTLSFLPTSKAFQRSCKFNYYQSVIDKRKDR